MKIDKNIIKKYLTDKYVKKEYESSYISNGLIFISYIDKSLNEFIISGETYNFDVFVKNGIILSIDEYILYSRVLKLNILLNKLTV